MFSNPKYAFIILLSLLNFFLIVPSVNAHVTVEPKEVGVGKTLKFTVDVPSEQNKATVAIRLVLPYPMRVGVYVKPGWNIEVKHVPGGAPNEITEIIWSGGRIPTQLKDEFPFFTSVPARETILSWKAYQTYEDGSVVTWDKDPKAKQPVDEKGNLDFSKFGPYAQTKIVDDLQEETKVVTTTTDDTTQRNILMLVASAVIFSALALGLQIYRK